MMATLKSHSEQRKQRRVRTIFSNEQLYKLEFVFNQQMYLVGQDRLLLAKQLNLNEAQVKIWFQNRRIKHRKTMSPRHNHLRTTDSFTSTILPPDSPQMLKAAHFNNSINNANTQHHSIHQHHHHHHLQQHQTQIQHLDNTDHYWITAYNAATAQVGKC